MGGLCGGHLRVGTLRWVMGCEVSYFPISLCCFFSPPTFPFKPGTLTVYFPTPPPFLTPATLSYYAGTMYLASTPSSPSSRHNRALRTGH